MMSFSLDDDGMHGLYVDQDGHDSSTKTPWLVNKDNVIIIFIDLKTKISMVIPVAMDFLFEFGQWP